MSNNFPDDETDPLFPTGSHGNPNRPPPPERRTLKQLREAAGLSVEELGDRCGTSGRMVQLLETGSLYDSPFPRYARALGATIEIALVFPNGRRVILVDP